MSNTVGEDEKDTTNKLLEQALFDYNMNTSVAGMSEENALKEYLAFTNALITKKQIELLEWVDKKVISKDEAIKKTDSDRVKIQNLYRKDRNILRHHQRKLITKRKDFLND